MRFKTVYLFDKQAKKLAKKYRNFKFDLNKFISNFEKFHSTAITIQKNLYKVRLSNSAKNRGKSSGYRIYYYLKLEDSVYLLTIYDKSEVEMIDEKLLTDFINEIEEAE